MTTKTVPVELPSIEEIELADYKLGSLLSDLDMIERAVKDVDGVGMSVEEYLADPAGVEKAMKATDEAVEPETLLRLLAFANEIQNDGQTLTKYGESLQSLVLSIYTEAVLNRPDYYNRARKVEREWKQAGIVGGNVA
jgi:hypothetical protein